MFGTIRCYHVCIYIYICILFSLVFTSLHFSSLPFYYKSRKLNLSARISLTRFATVATEYPPWAMAQWVKYKECQVDAWVKSCAGDEASGSNDMPPSALHDSQDAQISVHTIGGTIFCVNVSLEFNFLFDVIIAIADLNVLEGVEFDQMRLTLEGHKLNEKLCHCLSSYGVEHGCELGLVVVPSRCETCETREMHDLRGE